MNEQERKRAAGVLLRLGVPMRSQGWDWLMEAVILAANQSVPEERAIFAQIAISAGVSYSAVRSACLRAIKRAQARGLPDLPEASAAAFLMAAAELFRRGD